VPPLRSAVVEYAVGFAFDDDRDHVALILKDHPEWQRGNWNGIGGRIEPGETPHVCMRREFGEETGLVIPKWEEILNISGRGWRLFIFRAFADIRRVRTMTSETVRTFDVNMLPRNMVANARWLVPFALDDRASGGAYVIDNIRTTQDPAYKGPEV
jgi:8-oxo-dGTP diphosphatase